MTGNDSAKNLWKHFGPILNNSKNRRADTFNDFFSNVGRNLNQQIGGADKNFRK